MVALCTTFSADSRVPQKAQKKFRNPQISELFLVRVSRFELEGYRGKGIAKDLFRKFQEFASGCGAASIELKVMSRNRDALRLYASLGFCETKKYMALPLSQNGNK